MRLAVSDLARSIAFYARVLGMALISRDEQSATLGPAAQHPALALTALADPTAPSPHDTGLFHVAWLHPSRAALAATVRRILGAGWHIDGASDHGVSEALYLSDPDGLGIEIYADRPRELWEGQVMQRMTTAPIDVEDLLGELEDPGSEPFDGLPDGTSVGHVHLRVADVQSTVDFYRDVLGMGLMAQLGPMAAFLSAGGYHHHIAGNTWESRGASPAGPGFATLRHATIVAPDAAERDRLAARVADSGQEPEARGDRVLVRDPAQNPLLLTA